MCSCHTAASTQHYNTTQHTGLFLLLHTVSLKWSYTLYVSHISRRLPAEAVHLWSHLRCHTSSGASYVPAGEAPFCAAPTLQYSKQQSGLRHNRLTGLYGQWQQNRYLFKETEPPLPKYSQPTPTPNIPGPSLFTTHGHMIAADWACPLVFAKARVHNVHTWKGVAALGGRKCKGRRGGDCCCE